MQYILRHMVLTFMVFLPAVVLASVPAHSATLDEAIDNAVGPVSDIAMAIIFKTVNVLGHDIPLILMWLFAAAIFFTAYLGFINIRLFAHAVRLLFGKEGVDKDASGSLNRFQALSTSLSGTVGLGNIGGVAVAISLGGPGATFWMIMMGLCGMSSKFTETALAVKYRRPLQDGTYAGGAMYYLQQGFGDRGWPRFGKFMGITFAICCIGGAFGGGNMFQANQAYRMVREVTGGDASFIDGYGWAFGLMMALMVGIVIIGGIKSIAQVTSRIVPFMAGIYLLASLFIIGANIEKLLPSLYLIFSSAMNFEAGLGGVIGAMIAGIQRAAFSNEAGLGSAPIAHANAKTDSHISQGVVVLLEPFIDTVVICTMTALVIIITGVYMGGVGVEGVDLTSRAYASVIGWFPYILAVAVFLFAYSTMISWSYYGLVSTEYLFGDRQITVNIYKMLFCLSTVAGAAAQLGNVVNFTDAMIFSMCIPNIIGLYVMAPEIKKDLKAYMTARKNRALVS